MKLKVFFALFLFDSHVILISLIRLISSPLLMLSSLSLIFISPYYTVYDGINQVNNHGGNQPKTRVKQKNILLLHKYNSNCITKSSTSFHPVDSPYCPFGQGGSFFKRTLWQRESEISGQILKNGYNTTRRKNTSGGNLD